MKEPQLVIAFLILSLIASINSEIINENIIRTIDVTKPSVSIRSEITFSDANTNVKMYSIEFMESTISHLSYITASVNKKRCNIKKKSDQRFDIYFPEEIQKREKGILKLDYYLIHSHHPYPKEILQSEEQSLKYYDTHIAYSLYSTMTQTTTIKLPSGRINSYALEPKPVVKNGATVTYGPYNDIKPRTIGHEIYVHFPSNMPFITVRNVVKEIELSFWGKISVEEIYELHNTGAKLKNGFSRLDYEMSHHVSNSIQSLSAKWPSNADNAYYRDQIGNITTSNFRKGGYYNSYLEFRPRFPIFGGWKTQWYMGYTVDTQSVLMYTPQHMNYTLTMNFLPGLENCIIDELTVKVILPEGVYNISSTIPIDDIEESVTRRTTYADTEHIGRSVLTFKKKNVISKHNRQLMVSFYFDESYLLLEPTLFATGFFAIFGMCIIILHLESYISGRHKTTSITEKIKKE